MLLLLLIPLPYVDVTSSWRFINKWHRIIVAAAGMAVEVFVAAIACMVWVASEPGPLQYHAGNVIITATLHTLLFNANPLMKFDGYYMMSDFLEIPNLATRGRSYLKSVFKWLYFGAPTQPVSEVGIRGVIVKSYGFLAMAWFFSISLGLSLGASSMFEGFGLLIALMGLVLWFGIPVIKFIKFVVAGSKTEQPNRLWFATAASMTCAVLAAFLFLCPSPSVVSAPIVIDFEELSIVRSEAGGFAKTIHVVDGQSVDAGQLLVTMENLELSSELESLLVDVEIGELRCKTYLTSGDIAALKLEQSSLESMYDRVSELATLMNKLKIIAPQSGIIMSNELSTRLNTFLQPGDEILSIGMTDQLQAIALTRQQDVQWIQNSQTQDVQLFVWGQNQCELSPGTIKRVFPRARDDFPHDAFAASNGGPLAVVPRNQVESLEQDDASTEDQSLMLTEPRVQIEIALRDEDRQRLMPGQSGTMLVRSRDEKMGPYLATNFLRFIRKNTFRSHGL
jgi:putative peptide zinc metalloprotease protein